MEKKFIAIIVAFVILVTAVAVGVAISINKKDTYVDPDGIEHWLVKDEEGNTILNGEGDVVVYATDEKGQRQKDENGEYVTAAVDFPEIVTDGNTLETPDYKLTMPKGWDLQDNGTFILKKNENVHVKVDIFESEDINTIDAFLEREIELAETFLDGIKEGYSAIEFKLGNAVLTKKQLDCRTLAYKLEKNDGTVDYSIRSVYFLRGDRFFKISFVCDQTSYTEYGKDIDIVNIVDANFVVKDYMQK